MPIRPFRLRSREVVPLCQKHGNIGLILKCPLISRGADAARHIHIRRLGFGLLCRFHDSANNGVRLTPGGELQQNVLRSSNYPTPGFRSLQFPLVKDMRWRTVSHFSS